MALNDILGDKRLAGKGLRSWCFHVASQDAESHRMKSLKVLLTHPGICYSVDEVTLKDASHVMEDEFRRMQHEIHEIGDLELGRYLQEVSEVVNRVEEEKNRLFRFKVLLDLRILDEKAMKELLINVNDKLGRPPK
jgi:hypothetical protein